MDNSAVRIEGTKLTLFDDVYGRKYGASWVIQGVVMDPRPQSHHIKRLIGICTDLGIHEKIAYIQINAVAAVALWLEGLLTRDHFESAERTDPYIELAAVSFDTEQSYHVRIYLEADPTMAAYSKNGTLLASI